MITLCLIIMIMSIALKQKSAITPLIYSRITSIILLISGLISLNMFDFQGIGSGMGIYTGLFQITSLSQSFECFIFIMGSLAIIPFSPKNSNTTSAQGALISEYSLIILFTTLGSSLLLSSSNILSMYLSIELQSFGVYILSTIYRDSESSTSAGLKYFLLGGLSSCLILLGGGLIYANTGLTSFESIYSLLSCNGFTANTTLSLSDTVLIEQYQLGLIIILIGFLFKIAAAPLHNWAPDVYNDVPTIVTTWISTMPKIAIIIFLSEIITNINIGVLKDLFLISSLLSLLIGTIVGLSQSKIKRLLTYSTISHVGFMLLCLSINSEESLESLIFYLIQYSLTNLNSFLILLSFGYIIKKNKDISLISDLSGVFKSNPLLSLSFAVTLFSMAGIPPLMGFFAKQQVLYSSTGSGFYFISIIAIITSVISAFYYLKIIKVMHFDNTNFNWSASNFGLNITNIHSFVISSITLSLLFFMSYPHTLLNSSKSLALNIFFY